MELKDMNINGTTRSGMAPADLPIDDSDASYLGVDERWNTHNEEPVVQNEDSAQHDRYETMLKAFAGFGLIVILSIAAWGGVQFVRFVPNVATSLRATVVSITQRFIPGERITLDTIETATVGEPFELTWEHVGKGKNSSGNYSFSYPCRDDLYFETVTPAGGKSVAFCDTLYQFAGVGTTLQLTAHSELNRYVDVPLSIHFTEVGSDEISLSGSVPLTIENLEVSNSRNVMTDEDTEATTDDVDVDVPVTTDDTTDTQDVASTNTDEADTTTVAPQSTTPPPAASTPTEDIELFGNYTGSVASDPNGRPDLKVTILATGSISRISNEFEKKDVIGPAERAAVRFEIENLGTKETGNWYFAAVLPTNPAHIYNSKNQQSLLPGDKIEFTLGFDSIRGDAENEVIVNADPSNSVRNEVTRDNNIVKTIIKVSNSATTTP